MSPAKTQRSSTSLTVVKVWHPGRVHTCFSQREVSLCRERRNGGCGATGPCRPVRRLALRSCVSDGAPGWPRAVRQSTGSVGTLTRWRRHSGRCALVEPVAALWSCDLPQPERAGLETKKLQEKWTLSSTLPGSPCGICVSSCPCNSRT